MKDVYHDHKATRAIAPAVYSTGGAGTTVDLEGFNSALFAINTGAIVSSGNFGITMQEADDDSESWFENVAPDDQLGTLPATLAASTTYRLSYIGSKRFVRLVYDKASGTSIALSAVAVLGHPRMAPVA